MFVLNESILSFYSTLTHIQYRVVAVAAEGLGWEL
jgi:hypothetical protein